jgi:hypothetical protein
MTLQPHTQHALLSINVPHSLSFVVGGLQSKRSPASVLHGPTSLSITGLCTSNTSSTTRPFVSTCKLCVRLNLRLGSVLLMSTDSADFFFAGPRSSCAFSTGFGRLRFSQSSAVLGIGASFSLLTRLKLRFGDFPITAPAPPVSSSMGSRFFLPFLGFWSNCAASSVVLINGPFLVARVGAGGCCAGPSGKGMVSLWAVSRLAGFGFFLERLLGFMGKPPVEKPAL